MDGEGAIIRSEDKLGMNILLFTWQFWPFNWKIDNEIYEHIPWTSATLAVFVTNFYLQIFQFVIAKITYHGSFISFNASNARTFSKLHLFKHLNPFLIAIIYSNQMKIIQLL